MTNHFLLAMLPNLSIICVLTFFGVVSPGLLFPNIIRMQSLSSRTNTIPYLCGNQAYSAPNGMTETPYHPYNNRQYE